MFIIYFLFVFISETVDWQGGKVSGSVYAGGPEHDQFMAKVNSDCTCEYPTLCKTDCQVWVSVYGHQLDRAPKKRILLRFITNSTLNAMKVWHGVGD